MKQYQEIRQNWIGQQKFETCVCVISDHYYQIFICGRKTVFVIFPVFPNFLRSYVSRLT